MKLVGACLVAALGMAGCGGSDSGYSFTHESVETTMTGQQRYTITVAITCDGETGRCISEPASLAPSSG